jgi:hypothetical protein
MINSFSRPELLLSLVRKRRLNAKTVKHAINYVAVSGPGHILRRAQDAADKGKARENGKVTYGADYIAGTTT